MPGKYRVFIGLQEISGYYSGLESGLNSIGVQARLFNIHPHPFGYTQAGEQPFFARYAAAAVLRHRQAAGLGRQYWAFQYLLNVLGLLLWSLNKFDVYVFAWGQTFLPGNIDLFLLRAVKKRVIVNIGHGSEARPPYMSYVGDAVQVSELRKQTRAMSRRLRRLERRSSCVIALPTTAQMLRNEFVNFYALGLPIMQETGVEFAAEVNSSDKEKYGTTRNTIRILHVPSKPQAKGSAQISAAVRQLAERHPQVEYVELTGVSHDEVLRAIADCDIVVDQLWSDIPMAMVGLEAALHSKPSMIGGYSWGFWETFLSEADMPPSVRVAPDELTTTLEDCVNNMDRMRQLGLAARQFVSDRWSAEAVARRFERLIAGEMPTEWIFTPEEVRYGYGAGVPREQVLHQVSSLVEGFGWGSLCWPSAFSVYSSSVKLKH